MAENVSVVIVTYNHRSDIADCLRSCLANNPGEVIVVDNGSSDGTPTFVRQEFPSVTVVETEENGGYGAGVNTGASHTDTEYLVVLNPDTTVEPETFDELIQPLNSGALDVVSPKILTANGEVINTVGNINHFTGLSFVNGYGAHPDEDIDSDFAGVSGACFAMRREIFERIGGFDEGIFLYMEDVELSWRLQYHALRLGCAPEAVVYHEYELEVPTEKLYHLEFGRYYLLKKYWSRSTMVSLLPSLLMAELLAFGYAATNGIDGLTSKLQAISDGLRTEVEPVDADGVVPQMDNQVPSDQLTRNTIDEFVVEVANAVFRYNTALVDQEAEPQARTEWRSEADLPRSVTDGGTRDESHE